MSMPISRITSVASGLNLVGETPALATSKRSPAMCRSKPSAIWLLAELPVQRNKTRFIFISRSVTKELASGIKRLRLRLRPLEP